MKKKNVRKNGIKLKKSNKKCVNFKNEIKKKIVNKIG